MDYKSLRTQKELINMREASRSDWRAELQEEHPYVDVMPSPNKEEDAKKKAVKKGMEIKNEGLSIDDQMKMARESGKKRNPNPDHKAIRGRMLRKPLPKDTRTDAQKMTDAVGKPRMGSSD